LLRVLETEHGDLSYDALIRLDDGSELNMTITDPNAFLENLERN